MRRAIITTGVIGDEILVLVDVVVRLQGFFLRVNVVKVLSVENNATQSSACRQSHPGARNVSNATLIVAEFLEIAKRSSFYSFKNEFQASLWSLLYLQGVIYFNEARNKR